MTRHYLAQVDFAPNDAVIRDHVINDWHVVGPDDPTEGQYTALGNALGAFYSAPFTGQTNPVAHYLSNCLSRTTGATAIRMYRLPAARGPIGSPVALRSTTLGPAAITLDLPAECAAVLSFNGDLTDIPETVPNPAYPPTLPKFFRPAARLRGRIYLGPLNDQTNGGAPGQDPVLSSVFRDDVAVAATNMFEQFGADWGWEVFSRTSWSGTLVIGGHIDNAYDTQRRRGWSASARTPFARP